MVGLDTFSVDFLEAAFAFAGDFLEDFFGTTFAFFVAGLGRLREGSSSLASVVAGTATTASFRSLEGASTGEEEEAEVEGGTAATDDMAPSGSFPHSGDETTSDA